MKDAKKGGFSGSCLPLEIPGQIVDGVHDHPLGFAQNLCSFYPIFLPNQRLYTIIPLS